MAIEFRTGFFEYEHGRRPKGYGFWLFSFEGHEFGASGTYTDAKKKCVEYVRRNVPADFVGRVIVEVEP